MLMQFTRIDRSKSFEDWWAYDGDGEVSDACEMAAFKAMPYFSAFFPDRYASVDALSQEIRRLARSTFETFWRRGETWTSTGYIKTSVREDSTYDPPGVSLAIELDLGETEWSK